MWIVLAVILFLAAQGYLFRCLRKTDRFLEAQDQQKETLSVAMADPAIGEQMTRILERYCVGHPDVDLVLHIDPEVRDAVRQRKADAGLCADADAGWGLNCLTLTLPEGSQRQLIWKNDDKVGEFAQYLWQACGK